ncbi:putative ribosomal protein 20 mitochondrial [Diaporthe ampelina]|uniref:Putative ribosomal protein 20 mitochondrial n=1 Tax=Diaporthe ampelina TaxID=1214573 RepID=A0A0G2HY37_9PEZI|nr:putative ribosomal protein 20 mitochondrial [Diaporthe ampelina]
MEAAAQTFIRPATRSCVSSTRRTLRQQIRSKATASRTRRSLNISPHPSFLASDSRQEQDLIIFNPPASAPSVYHTPFKFLPKTDPRRRANLAKIFESHFAPTSGGGVETTDLPTLPPSRKHNPAFDARGPITKSEVEEMRRLREQDPHKWDVRALSDKYAIPHIFVMMCCQAPKEKLEFERKKMELIRQRWGPIRAKAKEDRHRRTQMLYRGEI